MKNRNFIYGMVMALFAITTLSVEGRDDLPESAAESKWTADALKILTGSTQFIEALPAFSASGNAGGELYVKNDQLVEYGTSFKVTFVRPEKLYLYMSARDGIETTLIFDGETITAATHTEGQHIYDTTPQPGDVNESLDFVTRHSGAPREMAYFLTKQLTRSLSSVQTGLSLGKSTIDGIVCDHLALRSESRDGQIWITRGEEPTPRRILITYRNRPAQPRLWIQFDEWDSSPELSESIFSYIPPEGAKQVDYFQD
jgi:hypothetical protein